MILLRQLALFMSMPVTRIHLSTFHKRREGIAFDEKRQNPRHLCAGDSDLRERKEREVLLFSFVPDKKKYSRGGSEMDEEIVRALRRKCEQPEIVCARQLLLQLPGTVFERISADGCVEAVLLYGI